MIVQFNAGKVNLEAIAGTPTFNATPDKTKGEVILVRDTAEQLTKFRFKNRQTGSIEERIVFPGDATFTKVDTSRPDDRVYLFQMAGNGYRMMVWMQNKDNSNDADLVKKLNDYLQNPNPPNAGSSGNEQAQLMQMLGLGGRQAAPTSRTTATPATTNTASGPAGGIQMSQLEDILSNLGLPQSPTTTATTTSVVPPAAANSSQVPESTRDTAETTAAEPDAGRGDNEEEEALQAAIQASMMDEDNEGDGDATGNGNDSGEGSSDAK